MPDTLAWYEALWIAGAAIGLIYALAGVRHARRDQRAVAWFAQNDRRRLIARSHLRNQSVRAGLCLVLAANGVIRGLQPPPPIDPLYAVVLAGTLVIVAANTYAAWADLRTRRQLLELGRAEGERGHGAGGQ